MCIYAYICVPKEIYTSRQRLSKTETFKGNLRMRSSPVIKLDIQTQRQDKKRKTDAHIMIPEMSCLTRVRKCFAGNSMKAKEMNVCQKRPINVKRVLYGSRERHAIDKRVVILRLRWAAWRAFASALLATQWKQKRPMYAKRDLYVSGQTFKRDLHKRCRY